MKKTFLSLFALVITAFALFSFYTNRQTSGIRGMVIPADGANWVWGISGTDTIKAATVRGSFVLPAKSGAWKVIIDANDPYKDAILERVEVKEGQVTDVGEIKLQQ